MWHLPRRKGFNVHAWRAPCKCNHGHDVHDPITGKCTACDNCRVFTPNYVCIGCDGRGDEHETVFETESERLMAKLPVGDAYKPLHDSPYLLQQVLEGQQRTEFAAAKKAGGASAVPSRTPEELLQSGQIDVAEYRRRIAEAPPEPPASSQRGVAHSSRSVVPSSTDVERLGPGVGPTGREYAQKGATVKQISLDVGGGQSIDVMTNVGRPMPQPGKDFSRPWVPAPPRRAHPSAAPRKEPLRARVEEIPPDGDVDVAQLSLSSHRSSHRSSAGKPVSSRAPAASSSRGSVRGRLEELNELRDAGLVTQAEYENKRDAIIGSL